MKSAAIISKPNKPELERIVPQVAEFLQTHGYQICVDEETAVYVPGHTKVPRERIAEHKPEFVIVLGGDGTMLAAARAVAQAGIPILGVNLGTLGFLAEVTVSELNAALQAVIENRCTVETRSMIHCHLMRQGQRVVHYDAMNDAVVAKSAIARIVQFEIRVNNEFVTRYNADGLIVSTPTGSTAYSLAAGGPIVAPDVDAVVITPISPHMLTHRPLVVNDGYEVQVVLNTEHEEAFLTVDGQVGVPLQHGDVLTCNKSARKVRLLRLSHRTFFDVLRNKLKWGER
jgi:NAD+ kinase